LPPVARAIVPQLNRRADISTKPSAVRQLGDATLEIVAIGPRDEHAIYRAAAQRLKP